MVAGIDQRSFCKENAATRALLDGKGAVLYVAGPGLDRLTSRREASTSQGHHEFFGDDPDQPERTVEAIFARTEPNGSFPE